jgi:hypothetical protein
MQWPVFIKKSITSQMGSMVILMTVFTMIFSALLISLVSGFMANARLANEIDSLKAARDSLGDRTISLMQSQVVISESVNVTLATAASTGSTLASCITAGDPSAAACQNVYIDFYETTAPGVDVKFASSVNKAYVSASGAPCVDSKGSPTSDCRFQVLAPCSFVCPQDITTPTIVNTSCSMIKVMNCDLQISPYSGSTGFRKITLRPLLYLQQFSNYVSSFSLHLSADKSAITVTQ